MLKCLRVESLDEPQLHVTIAEIASSNALFCKSQHFGQGRQSPPRSDFSLLTAAR